jgi:hypothetical protein
VRLQIPFARIPMTLLHSPVGLRSRFFGVSCGFRRALRLFTVGLLALLLPACSMLGPVLSLGMVKLQFGCLPEGTCIDTANGPVPVEELQSGDFVTGFSGQPVKISQIHQYAEDPATSRYLMVRFENGTVVSASPRHRICGRPASTLQPGDRCDGVTVTAVESIAGVSRSFDLLTGDAGYRIGGIPVNSMIEEMSGR